MHRFLLVAGLLLVAGPSSAQVIRSYESLDRAAGEAAYATLGFSVAASTGNTEYTDLDLSGALGFRGDLHWIRLYPGYHVRRSGGETQEHERSLHLRHSYLFSPGTRSFAFVQLQADESLDLDRRFLLGGGLRHRIFRLGEADVELGVGVMWEEEKLAGGGSEEGLRGTNLLSVFGTAGAMELTLTGFFQPALEDWGDHRVSAVGSAAIPLGAGWSLQLSARWRRDARPPPGVEEDDAGMAVGLRFSVD